MSSTSSQDVARAQRRRRGRARRFSALAAAGGTIAVLAVGCGGSGDDGNGSTTAANGTKPFTVGLMSLTLKNQFFVDQVKEIRRRVEQAGGKLVVLDADNDPTKQLQLAQNWLNTDQVQAMIGSTVDVNAFQPVLDEAAEKGVSVVLLGYQPKRLQHGQAVVTQDFRDWGVKGGAALARCVNERYGGKGEVAIVGYPNLPGPVIKDKIAGIREAVTQDAPQSNIYEQAGDATRVKTLQLTQTMLQAHPDLNAAIGSGDEEALGALQAMKGAGKDPKKLCVVGMSATEEGLQALKAGDLYANVDLGLSAIYDQFVDITVALIKNPDDPRYNERTVVTRTFRVLYP